MTRKWSDIKRSKDDPARAARVAARVDAELQKERDPMAILDDEPVGQYPESEPYDPEQDEPEPSEAYVYSFDLGDFESGEFTATRFPANAAVSGDWVCVARDDAHALELAQRAAEEEWNAPDSREHDDFTVEFVEATEPPILGSDLKGIRFT